jgi:hypothetical protein
MFERRETKEYFIQASVERCGGGRTPPQADHSRDLLKTYITQTSESLETYRAASHVLFGAAVRKGSAELRPGSRQQLPHVHTQREREREREREKADHSGVFFSPSKYLN